MKIYSILQSGSGHVNYRYTSIYVCGNLSILHNISLWNTRLRILSSFVSLSFSLCNMAQNDIGDWYRGIPMVTKAWFTGSIVVPLVGRFGLINPMNLILSFPHIFYRFQVRVNYVSYYTII